MGNCLVTKLKSEVQNDNLIKLGVLRISVETMASGFDLSQTNAIQFTVKGGKTCHLSIIGSGYFVTDTADDADVSKHKTEYDLNSTSTTTLYFSNGTYKIDIDNKYEITKLRIIDNNVAHMIGFDIADVAYCDLGSPIVLGNTKVYGNIENLANQAHLAQVFINNLTDIHGNIAALPNTLTHFFFTNSSLKVKVSDLGAKTSLANIVGALVVGGANDTVENLVAQQIANGRTVNSDGIGSSNMLKVAPFNGHTYNEQVGQVLCWESASKIYIMVPNKVTATKVYCKGYTQQEAEAAFSGKTIIRVDA